MKQKRKRQQVKSIDEQLRDATKTLIGACMMLLFVFAIATLFIIFSIQPLTLFWRQFTSPDAAFTYAWRTAISGTFLFFGTFLLYYMYRYHQIEKQYQRDRQLAHRQIIDTSRLEAEPDVSNDIATDPLIDNQHTQHGEI